MMRWVPLPDLMQAGRMFHTADIDEWRREAAERRAPLARSRRAGRGDPRRGSAAENEVNRG